MFIFEKLFVVIFWKITSEPEATNENMKIKLAKEPKITEKIYHMIKLLISEPNERYSSIFDDWDGQKCKEIIPEVRDYEKANISGKA